MVNKQIEKLKKDLDYYKRMFKNEYLTWFEMRIIIQTLHSEGQMETTTYNILDKLLMNIKQNCEGVS